MKSYGHLWEKIIADESMQAAWKRVRRGHGNSQEVALFEKSQDEQLAKLRDDLISGNYKPAGYRQFQIFDPKPRTISCAPIRDRIVHHALCSVISPCLEKSFSHASYACRVGYGSHRACQIARKYAGRYGYFCKLDIRHYFDSIEHGRLLEILCSKFREEEVRHLIVQIVNCPVPGQSEGIGLPIGNLTSQWFANVYLDEFDHLATAGFDSRKNRDGRSVGYLRYMDDMVFFAESKSKCWEMHDATKQWLEISRGLRIKDEATKVAPIAEGLPFLGLRIFPGCWRLKRERFLRSRRTYSQRERQYCNGDIDERKFAQCSASSAGSLQWFGFRNILKSLASGTGAASGSNRVQRGGNWNNNSNNCTSSNRNNNNPSNNNNNNGFRLSSTLPGTCQSPARNAGAPHSAETNMPSPGWPVASATVTPGTFYQMEFEL